jgi:hypothetical protein
VQPSSALLDRRQFTVGGSGLLSRAQLSPPLQTAERFNPLGGEESSPCSGLPEPTRIILPPTSFWLIILSVCPYLFCLNKWRDFISDRLNTAPARRSLWHAFLVCLQDPRNFWSTLLNISKCIRSCRLVRFLIPLILWHMALQFNFRANFCWSLWLYKLSLNDLGFIHVIIVVRGHAVALRHYATSRKVADSSPERVDFSIDLILPAALWPWVRLSL